MVKTSDKRRATSFVAKIGDISSSLEYIAYLLEKEGEDDLSDRISDIVESLDDAAESLDDVVRKI